MDLDLILLSTFPPEVITNQLTEARQELIRAGKWSSVMKGGEIL